MSGTHEDAETFEDELDAHIAESMKDPEYANADALHREAEASWRDWVPSMFADDENMHTAYVAGYKDAAHPPMPVDEIAELLAEHQHRLPFDSDGTVVATCTCDRSLRFTDRDEGVLGLASHRAHVAALLAARFGEDSHE